MSSPRRSPVAFSGDWNGLSRGPGWGPDRRVSRPRPWGQCMSKEGLPSARAVVPPPRLRTSPLSFWCSGRSTSDWGVVLAHGWRVGPGRRCELMRLRARWPTYGSARVAGHTMWVAKRLGAGKGDEGNQEPQSRPNQLMLNDNAGSPEKVIW